MHVVETTWTDARVEQLRRLHAEGLAFSLIGQQLGITRNACIGKAQRLGLDARPHFNNAPVRKLDPEEQARRAILRTQRRNAAQRRRWARAKEGISLPPEPLPEPAPIPLECRPCSLLELNSDTCRFPIGDPGEPDFHFCGAQPQVGPYCAYHDKLTHKPAPSHARRPFIQPRWNPA
jgi:GcrA cell cycle regulator